MMAAKFCPGGCQSCVQSSPGCEERVKSQQYGAARLQSQGRDAGRMQLIREKLEAARHSSLASAITYYDDVSWLLQLLSVAREEARMLREERNLQQASGCTQPDQSVHSPAGAGAQPPHQQELPRREP